MVTFTSPAYLLLFAPAFAWLVLVGRSMHGMARYRKRLAVSIRAIVLTLLILALAGAQGIRKNRGITTIFVLDRSASMSARATQQAEAFIRKSLEAEGPDDRAGLVVFGKDPVIDVSPGDLRSLGRIYSAPDTSSTDVAGAIRLACAAFPEGTARRIVLLSDGNETAGDSVQAAAVAATDGIQIDVVPPSDEGSARNEVMISDVSAPPEATQGEPMEIRVVVNANRPADGVIHLDRDGVPVARMAVRLSKGTNSLAIGQTAPGPGFHKYRAVVEAANDADPRNNVGMAFVSVRGRPRVLLVDGRSNLASPLERALKVQGVQVTRSGPEGLPTNAEEVQQFDSVIFDDLTADAVPIPQMRLLQSAVRDSGVGFGMIGGENSFLPGGYYETPIADVLPVDLNVRQRKSFPSTTMVIVVDASGSMSMIEDGQEKIKIAASAASSTVRMMSANDYVGVAGSTDQIAFVAPIQRAVDKDSIAIEIGRLNTGGGGIYIRPSLDFGEAALAKQNTRVRHMLLMADGADCDEQEGALAVAQRMVRQGMTLSVVAIGDGKDVPFCKALAATGKGAFYLARSAHQLQRLFTRDASMVSRSAIEEGTFLPKVDPGDEVLTGLDLRAMPPLHAYCLTSDRPLSRVPMRTGKDDPLLAFWQYGLGTSMAFTSDAQPQWARPWMGWGGFNQFWAQAVRSTMRHSSGNRLAVTTHRDGGRGVVSIEAFDGNGNPINGLQAKVHVVAPDGQGRIVDVSQRGPGRYEGAFDASQSGAYVVTAAEPGAGGVPKVTRAGFSIAYPPEYQAWQINRPLLQRIAKSAGGSELTNTAQAFRPIANPGRSVRDLWQSLVLLAAILFPFDVAVRRIALPVAAMWAALAAALAGVLARRRAVRITPVPQAQTISRLHAAKRSATATQRETPEEQPAPVITIESERKPAAPPPATEPVSAAHRLLEAKRKRAEDDN